MVSPRGSASPVSILRDRGFRERLKRPFAELMVFAFFSNAVAVTIPILVSVIIDKAIVHHDIDSLVVLSTVLGFMILAETVLVYLKNYLFGFFSTQISAAFGGILYQRLLELPLLHFKGESVGSLVTRMQALNIVNTLITDTVFVMLIDTLFMVLFLLGMTWISPSLTLGALSFVAIFGIASLVFSRIIENRYSDLFESTAKYQSLMVETIYGMESVRTLGIGQRVQTALEDAVTKLLSDDFDRRKVTNQQDATALLMSRASSLFVIAYGALLVIKGTISLGQLIAFQILLGMLQAPLQRLAHVVGQLNQVRVALRRVNEFFSATPERTGGSEVAGCSMGRIQFCDVSYSYPGKSEPVLKRMNFTIEEGTHVAIVGASGSGKSTLAKLMGGIMEPTSGRILYDEVPAELISLQSLRSQIAHASQDSTLFNGTILDNITRGRPDARIDHVLACARDAYADQFIETLDKKYLAAVGERGGNLSGGQRQRVVLARELVRDAPVMLLDEATNAVDEATEKAIFQNLSKRYKHRTFVFITHNLALAQLADIVLHVDEGHVSLETSRDEHELV